jgi:hypothetical protein
MGQYHKDVKVIESAKGLMGFPSKCHFLEIIHKKLTVKVTIANP